MNFPLRQGEPPPHLAGFWLPLTQPCSHDGKSSDLTSLPKSFPCFLTATIHEIKLVITNLRFLLHLALLLLDSAPSLISHLIFLFYHTPDFFLGATSFYSSPRAFVLAIPFIIKTVSGILASSLQTVFLVHVSL